MIQLPEEDGLYLVRHNSANKIDVSKLVDTKNISGDEHLVIVCDPNGQAEAFAGADVECYAKAKMRKQPTFTLVGQDNTAIETIIHWQSLVREHDPVSAKAARADDDVALFTEFADTNPDVMKTPD